MGWTSVVSKPANEDEEELVRGYRALSEESKELVKGMVFQLNKIASENGGKHNASQKNFNNNGTNIVNVSSSHFKQTVNVR